MRIVVLTGGIGGARFLVGVRAYARQVGAEVTAVVNVGDDVRMHGLQICPDLDSVMYTLGGAADPERGWGRVGETWVVKEELAKYGAEPSWFGLGDKDTATHLVRTTMLNAGYPLSAVTAALCERWQPGVTLLPATDDRLETHVVVDVDGERKAVHFQEWWVRYRGDGADPPVRLRRRRDRQAGRRRARGARTGPTWCCSRRATRWSASRRSWPCRGSGRPWWAARRRSSGCRRSSAARRCAAWPTAAWTTLGVEVSAAGVGALYGARSERRPARRLAGRLRRTPAPMCPASRSGRSRCG